MADRARLLLGSTVTRVVEVLGLANVPEEPVSFEQLENLIETVALILDHRSSADEVVRNFPATARRAFPELRLSSPAGDPCTKIEVAYDGETSALRLRGRDDGEQFDRLLARLEDITGGELITYGLRSYEGTDSYAYVLLHEDAWDELRDSLADDFDEIFVGGYARDAD